MKPLKILCLVLIAVVCFAVSSVVSSAWVYSYNFDYSTSFYSPTPFDVVWTRDNGNTYYYGLSNNLVSYDYYVASDSNLNYLIVQNDVDTTPFGEFNPRDTTNSLYQRVFRYAVSRSDFGGSLTITSGYYDNPMYFRLLPIPIIIDSFAIIPTAELDVYIGYRYYDTALAEYIYDEYSSTITMTPNSSYTYEGNLDIYGYDLYDYLSGILPNNVESFYIYELDVTADTVHNGFGYVTYLGYDTYRYPFYDIDSGAKPLLPPTDISPYIKELGNYFRQFLNIELLPGLAIYNIVSLAVIVPIGIAVIRKV